MASVVCARAVGSTHSWRGGGLSLDGSLGGEELLEGAGFQPSGGRNGASPTGGVVSEGGNSWAP